MTKLTTSQRFALGQTLSDYDPHMDYDQIKDAIHEEDYDSVTAWEPFEHMDPTTLCDTIDELEFAFRQYANQITRKLRDAIRDNDTAAIAEHLTTLETELEGA